MRVKVANSTPDYFQQASIRIAGEASKLSLDKPVGKRKQAGEALKESESRLKLAIEALESGIWELNVKTGKAWRSLRHDQIFGYTTLLPEWTYQMFLDHVIPEDRSEVDGKYGYALSTKTEWDFECRIRRVDKAVRWIWAHGKPSEYDDKNEVVTLTGIVRDITERKEAEKALLQSEERYRTILEDIENSYFEGDLTGNITFVNDAACRHLGYSREELVGMNYRVFTHPEDLENVFQIYNQVYRTGEPVELLTRRMIRKDGSLTFSETSVFPLRNERGETIGFRGVGRDVSERKQAEEALRQSEERYRTILEDMEESYYETDLAGNFTAFNDALCRHLGYSREELMGMNYRVFTPPEDVKRVSQISNQVYRTGEPVEWFPQEMIRKDGSRTFTETSIFPLRNESGEIVGWRGVGRDVTERKLAEGAIRQAKDFSQSLITSARDGISVLDNRGVHIDANPALCEMTGFLREELIGVGPPHPYWPPEKYEEIDRAFQKTMADDFRDVELTLMRKNGERFPAVVSPSCIKDQQGNVISYFATVKDITERKQAEQQALVNAKLASVGELVAGVAHEINNPLTGVIGYAQLLAERQDVPQNVKEDLQKIYEESQRTVKIVKNLLGFARQYKPEKNLVDISELIERTLELEAYKLRTSNVELSTKLAADLPLILADYNQLQQVVLNIITNAQQAMAETKRKGKIMVTIGVIEDYVRISITDNGPGIKPENMTKVFDPFYTTKPEGSGSGLGLSVCHGIITEHGGNIYAESTPGKGTTFTIELPIATGEQAVIKEKEPAKKKIRQPRRKMTGNILIVEDEPSIRAVLTRNLSASGFQLQAVSDGKAALAKLAKNTYDLIFTDLKMPGMSGIEQYETMKKKHPNMSQNVVFITGDVMTADTRDFLASTGRPYLVKPFDSKDIAGVIEEVLGG